MLQCHAACHAATQAVLHLTVQEMLGGGCRSRRAAGAAPPLGLQHRLACSMACMVWLGLAGSMAANSMLRMLARHSHGAATAAPTHPTTHAGPMQSSWACTRVGWFAFSISSASSASSSGSSSSA